MKKYLTVMIAGQYFAIPVTAVEDVMTLSRITPVPRMPEYIKGIIHTRGRILAVLDMLSYLGAGRMAVKMAVVVAAEGSGVAVTADHILDVRTLPDAEKLLPTLDHRVKAVAQSAIFDGSDFYIVIDPQKIVSIVKKKEAVA